MQHDYFICSSKLWRGLCYCSIVYPFVYIKSACVVCVCNSIRVRRRREGERMNEYAL